MISRVETWTEELERQVSLPPEFVVPGGAPLPPRSTWRGQWSGAPSGRWCRT